MPFEGLMILFGLCFALLGPIGFMIALVCLGRLGTLSRELENLKAQLRGLGVRQDNPPSSSPPPSIPVEPVLPPIGPVTIQPAPQQDTSPVPAEPETIHIRIQQYAKPQPQPAAEPMMPVAPGPAEPQQVIRKELEQQIGTQWILVAGIVCVIAAVGFSLKHAIDKAWLGPWARVSAVAAGGIVAFVIGEITRRRGYEVVAKGVSAMGFALLYAAVFWAYRGYHLVDSIPAFAAAIVITFAAMAYAVLLNEVLVAILSLLGGFATPLFLSTGQNLPHHLFGYVLILSLGATGCAFFRRWRAVNLLAFVGTFLLYILWFEKFTRPILSFTQAHPSRLLIAGLWLGAFFVVYLVMPLLYGWVKQTVTRGEDLLLPCAAGTITFYYLWTMLEKLFRPELALCTAALGTAYWVAAVISRTRCKQDQNVWSAMGIAGTAFLTAALPLYLKTYALVIGWTVESLILIAAGIFYAGVWMQGMGLLAMGLSLVGLFFLPSQDISFTPVFNGIFGTWLCAAAGILASHIVYRRNASRKPEYPTLSDIVFIIAVVVFITACGLEWNAYCDKTFSDAQASELFTKGLLCIVVFFSIVLTLGGLIYQSTLICGAGLIVLAASVAGLLAIFGHAGDYRPILNAHFGTWLCVGLGAAIQHLLYRYWKTPDPDRYALQSQWLYIIAASVLLGTGVLEWHRYWSHQEITDLLLDTRTLQAFLLAAAVFIIAVVSRPVCPAGLICRSAAVLVAVVGVIAAIANLDTLYYTPFRFVWNGSFAVQAAVVAALFIAAIQFRKHHRIEGLAPTWYQCFGLAGVVTLWAILSEQVFVYWYCLDQYGPGLLNWKFKAHMSLSLLWAAYGAVLLMVGFNRRIALLRFMALGLFGILLAKIFLLDMSEVKSIYRITAFFATGLTLVGVSYFYQYLRKQGFFDRHAEAPVAGPTEKS
ncbi:DUF2339 domain-containing protein [Anaerohalosphaeraceae bacterium U12dextr]